MSHMNLMLWVSGGLLIGATVALAQATTPYTGTEVPAGVIAPGAVTHPGGNTHIRDAVIIYNRTSSDARVNGPMRFVMNFNHDKDLSGPIWGTVRMEVGGGIWEGTFQGKSNRITMVGYYKAVWHGSGEFSGLQRRETCVYTGTPMGTCTGRILTTPAE